MYKTLFVYLVLYITRLVTGPFCIGIVSLLERLVTGTSRYWVVSFPKHLVSPLDSLVLHGSSDKDD